MRLLGGGDATQRDMPPPIPRMLARAPAQILYVGDVPVGAAGRPGSVLPGRLAEGGPVGG